MYGDYNLFIYDKDFNKKEEIGFDKVLIVSEDNMIKVLNQQGKVMYAISTNCCTVIVEEDNG